MLKFIQGLVQRGIYPQTEPELARQITLTNGITLTIFFFIVPFSIIFYYLGYELLGPLLIPIGLLFIPIFYLNQAGRTLASRLLLIILMNAVLGAYAFMFGRESGIHLLYFVFVGIPFLIFSLHEKGLLTFSVSLSAFMFYIVEFGSTQPYGSATGGQRIVYIAMISLILLWTVINFIYFSVAAEEKEGKIVSKEKTLAASMARSKDLEQFAYVVSHDLRSPVINTMQLIELLKSQENTPENKELLAMMADSVGRMNSLINDLLAYSTTGLGEAVTFVDCRLVVEEIRQDLSTEISQSQATIKIGELPRVRAHKTAIRSLFQNLISNAIKFRSGTHTPLVEVSSANKNGTWRFSVSDNGIGIDPQHATRIFDVFQRLHTNGTYPGNGIGLAHCKKIIDQHGGQIWVESQPGKGSTFYFTLGQVG